MKKLLPVLVTLLGSITSFASTDLQKLAVERFEELKKINVEKEFIFIHST